MSTPGIPMWPVVLSAGSLTPNTCPELDFGRLNPAYAEYSGQLS